MSQIQSILSKISLVTANYGEGVVLADVLQDWFNFLGGKPGEVVIVDCGSSAETKNVYWQMFQEKQIDKLQLIHDDSEDFGGDKGYIKDYTAGAIASKPYLLFFKIDVLPYRKGHDNWLAEAISYLDRDNVFAISGTWNLPSKHRDAWDGWYFSKYCSYNFALLKRSSFIAATHEFANDFILSGFKGKNPAAETGQDRYLIEVAAERYMKRHQLYTLTKVEDPNWTIFHTNVHNERLRKTREKYLKRNGIEKFMDYGNSSNRHSAKALYYGMPPRSLTKRLRIAVGASFFGPFWRAFKKSLAR